MSRELIETRHINNRTNLYLPAAVAEENLNDGLVSKGRKVGEQFARINNARLIWLKETMPAALTNLSKIEKATANEKTGCTTAFVVYLSAHEAHHRSQITLALKQSGHPVDKKTLFGVWEFGVR